MELCVAWVQETLRYQRQETLCTTRNTTRYDFRALSMSRNTMLAATRYDFTAHRVPQPQCQPQSCRHRCPHDR
jgi:hypothetical protein